MSDRVALVIGGGSGLGAATAVALAADGCRVVTADLAGADRVVDVTDEASVSALFAAVGRVDVVVTTAGVSTLAPVADHDAAEWRRVLDVNLTGSFLVIKHARRPPPRGRLDHGAHLAQRPAAGRRAWRRTAPRRPASPAWSRSLRSSSGRAASGSTPWRPDSWSPR